MSRTRNHFSRDKMEIERGGQTGATVKKALVSPDDALILAVTVCIDQMTHDVG